MIALGLVAVVYGVAAHNAGEAWLGLFVLGLAALAAVERRRDFGGHR